MTKIPEPIYGRAVGPWRNSFAWLPKRTWDTELLWLRPIKRRLIQKYQHLDGGPDHWWQYARPSDVAAEAA